MFYVPAGFHFFLGAFFYYFFSRLYPSDTEGDGKGDDDATEYDGKGGHDYPWGHLKLLKSHGEYQDNQQHPYRLGQKLRVTVAAVHGRNEHRPAHKPCYDIAYDENQNSLEI